MKHMFYFLAILFSVNLGAQNIDYSKMVINDLKESDLFIIGKTNVNTFTCLFNINYLKKCQEVFYIENDGEFNFKNAVLVLDTQGFDCGSKPINRDFNKLLQTDEYPEITIEVRKAQIAETGANAIVAIGIAGKALEYKVPVTIINTPKTHFKGVLQLKLSDYELELPKKLFGLIEVKDEIEIHFNIVASYKRPEASN
ncbi:MAG: YceI family protein [Leeuwenhoekiella sp.]